MSADATGSRFVTLNVYVPERLRQDEPVELIDYEARYGDEVAAEIRGEQQAWRDVRALLNEAARISVCWGLNRIGDGYGGALIGDWIAAIEQHLGEPLLEQPDLNPKKARSPISATKRVRIFARDGYRCLECGESDPESLTLDHIVAWSKGGSDDDDNLRTLCRPCNSRKGTKDLDL